MTAAGAQDRPWRRVAVAGSTRWPTEPAWEGVVVDALWDQLKRTPHKGVLYVRHGDADDGPDNIAHRWCREMIHQGHDREDRWDVLIVEEPVPADWEHCGSDCKPVKANGDPHRRPNPGYPHKPRRGGLPDYCPAAGHRRNPHVVVHPDHPVHVLLAFLVNDSPGTSKTVEHARRGRVPHRTWNTYL